MVQGSLKNKASKSPRAKSANSASVKKAVNKTKQAKKGSTVKLPNKHHRSVAMEERELSKVRKAYDLCACWCGTCAVCVCVCARKRFPVRACSAGLWARGPLSVCLRARVRPRDS